MGSTKTTSTKITIPSGTVAGTYTQELKIDSTYSRIVGFAFTEKANTGNTTYDLGLKHSVHTILDLAPSDLYDGSSASPNEKFKSLSMNIETDNSELTYRLDAATTADLVFTITLELIKDA